MPAWQALGKVSEVQVFRPATPRVNFSALAPLIASPLKNASVGARPAPTSPTARPAAQPSVNDPHSFLGRAGLGSPSYCHLIRQRHSHSRVSLQRRVKAHVGAITAVSVLQDGQASDFKQVVTAGMDKTLAHWELLTEHVEEQLQVLKSRAPGGPVFSLANAPKDPLPGAAPVASLYCGTAAKEVIGYVPASAKVLTQVRLDGHTGWVRSLATAGKYLLSCGCNHLRLWDTTFAVPREASAAKLFTGDILTISASKDKVVTGGADGSLRSFAIRGAKLVEGPARARAHEGRVTGCVLHVGQLGRFVYTVSFDGCIKGWSADTLELVMEVKAAHGPGARLHCICLGPDGVLYTGGDDKLIRRWSAAQLEPAGPPLAAHDAAVRVLAAGPYECLVSGDAEGHIGIWKVEANGAAAPGSARAAAAAATTSSRDEAPGSAVWGSGWPTAAPPPGSVVFKSVFDSLDAMDGWPAGGGDAGAEALRGDDHAAAQSGLVAA